MLNRFLEVISCFRQTSQWLLITLDYARLRRLHFPYDLRLRSGQTITLLEQTDVIIFWLVFVRHHYPVKPSDQAILDVGANIGMFTLYAASRAPGARIIAIEPFPDTCTRLRSCIERNRLSSRVTILNFALTSSSTAGSMDIGEVPSQYRQRLGLSRTRVIKLSPVTSQAAEARNREE